MVEDIGAGLGAGSGGEGIDELPHPVASSRAIIDRRTRSPDDIAGLYRREIRFVKRTVMLTVVPQDVYARPRSALKKCWTEKGWPDRRY